MKYDSYNEKLASQLNKKETLRKEMLNYETELRQSSATHKIILELIDRAGDYDCVDFYHDIATVLEYARHRMEYYITI